MIVANLESAVAIKEASLTSLKVLENCLSQFDRCALLDYPNYPNIGDGLIWLGELFYLANHLQIKVGYSSHVKNFSAETLEKQVGHAPILLTGGGNFGDLWSQHQKFREKIITDYPDRPIFILPQTIYFRREKNLEKTAAILNAHPNLTLFVRDTTSLEVAKQHFHQCQVILAPDMAFQMAGMPQLQSNFKDQKTILYHQRVDREKPESNLAPQLPNLVVEDWASFHYLENPLLSWIPETIARKIPRGEPLEWLSNHQWQSSHPWAKTLDQHYNPAMHRQAWRYLHEGVFQFRKHRLIITNRLHGHILCTLMGIPHLFLSNAYYKNQAFYEAWTHSIPFCRFVTDPAQINPAVEELLALP